MFKTILNIILLFLSTSQIQAQFLPPYKFQEVNYTDRNVAAVGHFTDSTQFQIVNYTYGPQHNTTNVELRISDNDYSLIDVYNADLSKGTNISSYLKVSDIDNDGLDELLFASFKNDSLFIHFWDLNNTPTIKRSIFSCNVGHMNNETSLFYFNPQDSLVIIHVKENYPNENSYRGLFALNPYSEKPLIWENKSAYFFTFNILFYKNSIFAASSAVDNNFIFYDGNFYSNPKIDNKTLEKLENFYNDFSSDSKIALVQYDIKTGEILKKKTLGGPSDWIETIKNRNDNFAYAIIRHRHSKSKRNSELYKLNLDNLELEKIRDFHTSSTNLFNSGDTVSFFSHFGDSLWVFKDFNLVYSKNIPGKTIIIHSSLDNFKANYLYYIDKTVNKGFLLDNNLNVIADFPSDYFPSYYFPKVGIFLFNNTKVPNSLFYEAKLVKRSIGERFTQESYFYLFIFILLLLSIVMVLWVFTLRISYKKISHQKEEIERKTALLIHSEKLVALSTIAAGIAHELNSPLGAIINSVQRIKNSNSAVANDRNFELIEKSAKKSKHIAEKFLLSTRASNSSEDFCSPNEVIEDTIELIEKQFGLFGIEIKKSINFEGKIKISYSEFSQILTNLITNSKDAILEKNDEMLIEILVSANETICEIQIQDSGTGFSSIILNNKISAFTTTKPKGKGNGLGLWIIENTLKKVNGTIHIENNQIGALVKIEVPIYSEDKNEN